MRLSYILPRLKMATPLPTLAPEVLQSLLDGPAGQPPSGVIPNFQDPPNLNVLVIITIALCVSSATIAVLIRIYTKRFLLGSLAYEDCKSFQSILSRRSLSPFRYYSTSMGKTMRQNGHCEFR